MKTLSKRYLNCTCGTVKIELAGSPIMASVCHCKFCQAGSKQIEQLPNAPRILDQYNGTPYVLFRKDRVKIIQGTELLTDYRLEGESKTRRVVASCCNSPLFLDFEPGHWVSLYQERFDAPVPRQNGGFKLPLPPQATCPMTEFQRMLAIPPT